MLLSRLTAEQWVCQHPQMIIVVNEIADPSSCSPLLDVNRKDYRAWYGLGQAYELLNMHQYALHYYQHATALR